jgi:RNA polymerase sigma-70 factor (ECF subfamily)
LTALPHPTPDPLWSPAQRARLVRLCAAVVADAGAAEDLAQETLLEAWRHRDRLVDPSGSDAWLNAIARNVCRRWLRARGADTSVPTATVPEAAGGLDDVLEREDVVRVLERALALLPAPTSAALVGHYVEELSHADIAERLGTSADAVSMRVSRGRARLRHLLETELADEAITEGWVRRHDSGWRATRLPCADCGRAGMEMRRDAREVAFRCRWCDTGAISSRLPLTSPAFAALVGDVRRPTAVQSRLASWTRDYWSSADPRCVRCDRGVTTRQYTREGPATWSCRRGWCATCDTCGEEVNSSVAGIVLSLPQVRAARTSEPRLRMLPVRDVVRDGRAAQVVALGLADGAPRVAVVVLADDLRVVHVDSPTSG